MLFCKSLGELIAELERLPGVGPKSAQRLALYLLKIPNFEAERLTAAIINARKNIRFCDVCYHVTDREICEICSDPKRDNHLICVVAEPRDVIAMERISEYHGKYHVLHGLISPMENIGPDDIKLSPLVERVTRGTIQEIILATNPTVEGDTTAMYIARLLKPFDIKITRIAYGMPVGGDLDYADQATILSALQYRREII